MTKTVCIENMFRRYKMNNKQFWFIYFVVFVEKIDGRICFLNLLDSPNL